MREGIGASPRQEPGPVRSPREDSVTPAEQAAVPVNPCLLGLLVALAGLGANWLLEQLGVPFLFLG